jgi:ABC-2 type transport system permease protein
VAGFLRYLLFIVRRERITGAIWVSSLVLFTFAIAAYYPSLFPDKTAITGMTEMFKSPAMVGMMSPIYGGELPTVAMLFSQEMSVWLFIAAAVMNIFFVNRHTRADEELGRLEMFRALPVGRLTGAASVMCGAFVLNAVIAALTAILVAVSGMNGGNFAGAAAYALAIFGVGYLFAALTFLFAQLFNTSRGVASAAFTALGLFYMIRAAGDIQDNALAFISPLGLGLRVFAFDENNFECVAVLLVESVVIMAVAFAVLSVRDHGVGIIPARKGRAKASRFLQSPFGLAWRLTMNTALIWCVVVFAVGAMFGVMFGDIEEFANQNEYYRQIIAGGTDVAGSMIDNFAAFLFVIMALFSVIPVINIANKIHAEEKRGRLESVLTRSVGRRKLYGAYIIIGAATSIVVQFFCALGVFAPSRGLVKFGDMLAATLAYIPALLLMFGLAVFLVGVLPKLTALVWVVYVYAAFAAIFLRMFDLPDWLSKLSPFGNVPQLPVQEFDALPLVLLTVIAIVFTIAGVCGFKRRDIG